MTDYTGQRFGTYRLIHMLGKGSFADVYLGKHLYLKTDAAIKVLYDRLDRDAVENFLTEARHLRQLEHPHIIRIHDFGIEGDAPFLVMEYASGGTLRERHPKGTMLPLTTIVSYVQQIAAALDYAHGQKLIHRDLKPENLLLNTKSSVLLSDFGVALPMRTTDSMSVQAVGGTLAYMAPEQIRGKPRPASDQYALAVMVYEWVCGQRPFAGDVAELCGQHLFVLPPSLCERVAELPSQVEQVIFKALSKDPHLRFVNADAFAEALSQACQGKVSPVLFEVPEQERSVITEPSHKPAKKEYFNNIPAQLTRLIGREQEREAACVLLVRPEVRLLTTTGPGGIGKTRLALSVASDVQQAFLDGVCYVPLTSVRDPDLVLPTIFQALNIKGSADATTISSMMSYLRERHLLLVLDNFEQVIDAAPLVLELLQRCPDLTLLVTSRVILHVPGEHTFPLSPLALPDLKRTGEREALVSCASVALFLERVREISPTFVLTPANMRAVAEVCTRLDGLPLAVELAAARIQIMSPQMLLTRLKRRLDLLASTAKTLPARQQTVRKTIQWSYDLLKNEEQLLLQRLSVFVGGCRMIDVESLYEMLGEDSFVVMDGIAQLLDSSLIYQVVKTGGEPRLYLLETIREFGLEQLATSGNLARVQAAHAEYYQSLAPEIAPEAIGAPQGEWIDLVQQEFDNMLAALRCLQEGQQYAKALRFTSAMGGLWIISGYRSLGVSLLTQMLDYCQKNQLEIPAQVKAEALLHAGRAAMYIPDLMLAAPLMQECIQLLRSLHDTRILPFALLCLSLIEHDLRHHARSDKLYEEAIGLLQKSGVRALLTRMLHKATFTMFYRGELVQARERCEQCLLVSKEFNDTWMIAASLHFQGWIAYCRGAYVTARASGEEAVALFRSLNFPTWGLEALCVLAYEVAALGDERRAQELFEEALSHSQEAGEIAESAHALCGLGRLALRRNDHTKAQQLFDESITAMSHLKLVPTRYNHVLACALEGMAEIAVAREAFTWAARLFGAADSQRNNDPYYNPVGIEQPFYDRVRRTVQGELGEKNFAKASLEGQQMYPSQAMVAQDALTTPEASEGSGSVSVQMKGVTLPAAAENIIPIDSLTRREQDVLRKLAEGLSNAEIAEYLVLSVVTVNSYLRSIYSKLGVSSRTRAIRYAMEYHLV